MYPYLMRKLLTPLIAALMLAAGLSAPAVAAPAAPAAAVSVSVVQAAKAKPCKAKKKPKANYWTCVTPGSYCPKAARKKYGYAYKTMKRYRCMRYDNGQWRWKRA